MTMVWLLLLATLVIVALGGILLWQIRQLRATLPGKARREGEALRILEERYARGEIDQQELEERRHTVRGS